MLAQSVAAMTINRSCMLAGHGRSITSESSVTPLFIQQTIKRRPVFAKVYECFSRIKKKLGRIETRTRDRIYCQTIRTVTDISRDDRAIIATCSLRTLTDRLKENYSIDYYYYCYYYYDYYGNHDNHDDKSTSSRPSVLCTGVLDTTLTSSAFG